MTSTQRWTLTVVSAATAMLMLDIAVVNTALSDIAKDLDTGLGGLQWVVDAYTLALATTVLTAGALADRLGRKKLFLIGMTVFTATSIVAALSTSIEMLNTARAAQGVGGAILFAVSLSLLANAFPSAQERGKALAVYGATIAGSFAIGPLVGGALTSGLDWSWIFLVNVPVGLAALGITVKYVEESKDPHWRPIDWPGQATLTAGLSLLVLALLRGNEDGWTSALIIAELSAGLGFIGAFVAVEAKVKEPMLPLGLFKRPDFTGAQVAAFAISASFFAVFLYTTLYLQQILGLSAIEAGLVYLPGTMVMFIVSGATASLSQKVHPGVLVSGGLAIVSAGLLLSTIAGKDSAWYVLLPGMVLAMAGSGLFNPAVSAVALGSAPPEQSGLAAGVNDTFRQAGIAVGVAGLGALVPAGEALGGNDPQAYVDGLREALLVGGALAGVGAIAAAYLIRGKAFAPAAATEAATAQA